MGDCFIEYDTDLGTNLPHSSAAYELLEGARGERII